MLYKIKSIKIENRVENKKCERKVYDENGKNKRKYMDVIIILYFFFVGKS